MSCSLDRTLRPPEVVLNLNLDKDNRIKILEQDNNSKTAQITQLMQNLNSKTTQLSSLASSNIDLKNKLEQLSQQLISSMGTNQKQIIEAEKAKVENSLFKQNIEDLKTQLKKSYTQAVFNQQPNPATSSVNLQDVQMTPLHFSGKKRNLTQLTLDNHGPFFVDSPVQKSRKEVQGTQTNFIANLQLHRQMPLSIQPPPGSRNPLSPSSNKDFSLQSQAAFTINPSPKAASSNQNLTVHPSRPLSIPPRQPTTPVPQPAPQVTPHPELTFSWQRPLTLTPTNPRVISLQQHEPISIHPLPRADLTLEAHLPLSILPSAKTVPAVTAAQVQTSFVSCLPEDRYPGHEDSGLGIIAETGRNYSIINKDADTLALAKSSAGIKRLEEENEALRSQIESINAAAVNYKSQLESQLSKQLQEVSRSYTIREEILVKELQDNLEKSKLRELALERTIEGLKDDLKSQESDLKWNKSPKGDLQNDPLSSPAALKLFRDQVNLLTVENEKLQQDNGNLKVASLRCRDIEIKNTELREEIRLLNNKIGQLQTEIANKSKEVILVQAQGEEMLQKLRDEIRVLKEGEAKREAIDDLNPNKFLITNSSQRPSFNAHSWAKGEGFDQKLQEDKLTLETNLAKAENELREKDAFIKVLESKLQDVKSSLQSKGILVPVPESALKKELTLTKERLFLLEARERELLETEKNKDNIIQLLKEQLDEADMKNNSMRLE
jgi:hypothetical protein